MNPGVKIFLIIVILAALAAAILLIYMGQRVPILERVVTVPLLEDTAGHVLTDVQDILEQTTTAHYTVQMTVSGKLANEPVTADLGLEYAGQLQDRLIGTATVQAHTSIGEATFVTEAAIDLTDEYGYLHATELPAIPFMSWGALADTWYSFPNHSADLNIPAIRAIQQYVTSVTRLPDETADGATWYHYRANVDADSLFGQFTLPFTLPPVGTIPVELLIDKDTHRLYQVSTVNTQIPLTVTVTDYETAVQVTEPSQSVPAEQLPVDLFDRTSLLDLPLFARLLDLDLGELATDSDGDDLLTVWEMAFQTDPHNPDTDHDGYTDGEEVRGGYSPTGTGRLLPLPAHAKMGD